MSKYLLTGGSGTLGTELQKYLDCMAPRSKELDIVTFSKCDINPKTFANKVEEFCDTCRVELLDIDTLIHCAAWTDVPGAEIDKGSAVFYNIIGTHNMARFARDMGWKFVYISTDYVYPGLSGNYAEESKTNPFNYYGFTKLGGEAFVGASGLVVRTSFKPNDLWETKYNKAFIDVYTSADYADVIGREIAFAIHSELCGTYNVATKKKSIYELATSRYPEVGEMDRWEVSQWIKMPGDISMNIDKYTQYKEQHLEEYNQFVGGLDD